MKARRQLTPEQKAATDARRSRFRDLARKVAKMSDAERAALVSRMPAIVTIEGRALSGFNSCLVIFQNPQASLVGGFKQWIAHGRAVRKGQHGLGIWIPCSAGGRKKDGSAPELIGENPEGDGPRFVMGTVFDVTQTQEIAAGDGDAIDITPAAPLLALNP